MIISNNVLEKKNTYISTEKAPFFSILVPVYNAEVTLSKCIDHILLQTFADFELLLINDGSTDRSRAICNEYVKSDSRVRIFNKLNEGVSSARNIGLSNMHGEYVCFCDADDYVTPDWLFSFYKGIGKSDLIVTSFYGCRSTGISEIESPMEQIQTISDLVSYLEDKNIFGYLWCKAFKVSLITKNKISFNTEFRLWEDADFIYRYLICVKQIKYENIPNYYYYYPLHSKYAVIENFDCSLSIIRTIKELNTISEELRKMLIMKYGISLVYHLIQYYKNRNYHIGLKKLKVFTKLERDLKMNIFNKSFGIRYLHFKRFPLFTHLLFCSRFEIMKLFRMIKHKKPNNIHSAA